MKNKYDFIERTFGGGGGSLFDFEIPAGLRNLKDDKLFVITYLKNNLGTAYIAILTSDTCDEVAWIGNPGGKEEHRKNNHE